MRIPSIRIALAALLTIAAPLVAQNDACTGPGAPFGVLSYECGDCSMVQKPGERTVWSFRTEPRITRVAARSPFQLGDILVAVDDKPITSAEGATSFAYPNDGSHTFTVRRNGAVVTVTGETSQGCLLLTRMVDSVRVLFRTLQGDSLQTRPARGRYGFAIACDRCIGQVTGRGVMVMKYETEPRIAELDADGPAARAGLTIGDVIVAVNGKSVLDDAGSRAFADAERASSMQLTVRRSDGSTATVELRARTDGVRENTGGRGGRGEPAV